MIGKTNGDTPNVPRTNPLEQLGFDADGDPWINRLREAEAPFVIRQIGPFELLQEVGRGGQGVVYRARDTRTEERVAAKLLLAGPFATTSARQRVRREVSAATALDHRCIVKIRDVLVIDEQILLVMEWVNGLPITSWVAGAGEKPRSTRELFRVFVELCDAVHHAHQRGVIHRDLKPSNLLVDGAGNPHVLDFGMAKLATAFGPASADLTASDQFLGTPAYCSPEQVRGRADAVDVRTDVYSMGVVLYESLCGQMPYSVDGALVDVFRAIERDEPVRPRSVVPSMDPEVEAIVMKAIEKSPTRRYRSIAEFGDDLGRWLIGEPCQARAQSRRYRWGKWIARHRATVAFAMAASALLVAYVASVTVMYARAQREVRRAARVQHFLHETLTSASPYHFGGDVTLSRLLEQTSRRIEVELAGQPEIEADVRRTIAESYAGLWMWDRAEPHARQALELLRSIHHGDHPAVAACLNLLARALASTNDPHAVSVAREALAMRRRLYAVENADVAESMQCVGFALMRCVDPRHTKEIDALYRSALDLHARLQLSTNIVWARGTFAYAAFCAAMERGSQADELYSQAIDMFRTLATRHGTFYLAQCLRSHGDYQFARGLLSDAERSFSESLAQRPSDRPTATTAELYWKLAVIAARGGRDGEALRRYHRALTIQCEWVATRCPVNSARLHAVATQLHDGSPPASVYGKTYALVASCDSGREIQWMVNVDTHDELVLQLRSVTRFVPMHEKAPGTSIR